jgi:hypothetical protein
MFANQYRIKAPFTVSGGGYLKIACVAAYCLFGVTVTLVWLIRLLMLGVAKMFFHLGF